MKVLQSFLPFFASLAFANDEASYTEDVGGLFRTMEEHPERVALRNIDGNVPEWLKGSMFRNGPGQYEYGTDHFRHIFDPSAIIQKIEFDNGNVHYQSKYIESTHRLANVEKNAIVYSEMGTWAEPERYEELEDDELSLARCLHLNESFPSDNTIVSLYPIHGWMVGFTESRMVTLNDPETLETKHVLDLGKSAPEGYFIITVLAHGSLDKNGDFWTMSVGVQKESYAFMPKTAYGTLKIKNAVRDVENPFAYQASPEEFLASVEFGDSLYNEDERDRTVRYFHMFVQTPEYLVLPVTSIELDPAKMTDACKNGQPPMDMMLYNEEKPGYFKIFDKKNMKWFPKTFTTEAFMQIHMIQAYVDAKNNKIIFDTCETPKGDIMMAYYLETVNATGQALQEVHESMLPIGVPVRYEFGLDGLTAKTEEYVEPTVLFEPDMENWPMYTAAGTDFPMINFDYLGVEYDHFWSTGMGNVMADRLYHSQISTGDRHVWREVGYSPSEPFFVSRPGATSETDGVLLSLVSAFEGHSHLRPFMLILDPIEMTEIARIWLPEDYDISVSFHGTFVKH